MSTAIAEYEPAQLPAAPARDRELLDPSTLGFPFMLPVEIAMGEDKPKTICEAYGITRDEFAHIVTLPSFARALKEAQEMIAKEGSFRIKARWQAEGLLRTSWTLIHAQHTPANVKADLIKATFKVAGFEPKADDRAPTSPLQINIQLNN